MTRIIFLDCGRRLESYYSFMTASIWMAGIGFIIVSVIMTVCSGKIIKPIADSYEKQKRFITDAGHEIKTPLTVINANVELLEMEIGYNESLNDISEETKRLRALTDDLVALAQLEEQGKKLNKIEFPISEVIADAVHRFKNAASAQEKLLLYDIQPWLTMTGDAVSIERLINILIDNALKYSLKGGAVWIKMVKQGKNALITVTNQTATKIESADLVSVFERFYRKDSSRNSETGGHGIGLSIAKMIVQQHNGKISAHTTNGYDFTVKAVLPL